MANSGSFNTNSVGSFYFAFEWRRVGYDSTKNEHYIHYTLYAHNAAGKYRTVYLKNLYVNGSQVFYTAGTSGNGKSYYDGNEVTSGDMTIGSYNNAGDGAFSASFEAGVGQYPSANCSGSGSWNLDRIPRYLNSCNLYASGSYLNILQVNWNCDPSRDYTQYRLNGGGWADAGDAVAGDGKSGWFNIGGLEPNKTYSVQIRLKRSDSQLWSESNTISMTTKDIARINSPNSNFNLNSDNSLTVTCTNPSGNDIAYFLDCPSGTRRLTSNKTKSTSYTWTKEQILSMLQYCKESNTVTVKVGLITYGNTEYYSEKVGTLNVVNSNPTFSNFVYEDTNSKTISLTGNNQFIVKGYSNVKATISAANKAIAKNYAYMKKYRFVIGSSQSDIDYSDSSSVSSTINSAKSNIFTMYAIDSRENSSFKQISPSKYIDYNSIAINKAEAIRENGIGTSVLLTFDGSIWEGNFGVVLNEIKSCSYKYKETTSTNWIEGTTVLNPVRNGSKFSFEGLIKGDLGANGFDANKSYNIKITIYDKLTSADYDYVLGSGKPGIAITKDGIAINGMYDENLKGALQIWNGDVYIDGKKIN